MASSGCRPGRTGWRSHLLSPVHPKLLGTSGIVGFPISQFVLGVEGRHILQCARVHLPVNLRRIQVTGCFPHLPGLLPALPENRSGWCREDHTGSCNPHWWRRTAQSRPDQVGQVFVHVKGGILGVKLLSSTSPSVREQMTVMVRFLLRHRFAQAIEASEAFPRWRLVFFRAISESPRQRAPNRGR